MGKTWIQNHEHIVEIPQEREVMENPSAPLHELENGGGGGISPH
jgi:hypothetical protein